MSTPQSPDGAGSPGSAAAQAKSAAAKAAKAAAAAAATAAAEAAAERRMKAEKLRAEWQKQKPSNYLSFIRGFDAFPSKTTTSLNPSVLFDVVKTKDSKQLKLHLLADGNVNVENSSGSTLCHEAVRTGDLEILEIVIAFRPGTLS